MKAKPILFSGPMVRALLEGWKTQTRRVLKLPNWASTDPNDIEIDERGVAQVIAVESGCLADIPLPYAVGDLLWVRETHRLTECECTEACRGAGQVWYVADCSGYDNVRFNRDRPSIHMPRWASRLTLEVTNVRVERLQDISKDDVIAEGIAEREGLPMAGVVCGWHEPFAQLWDAINGAGVWDANPWVVALTFTVHKCNVDAMPQRVREVA